MHIETYFLRFAFPCAHVCLERKEITKEEFEKLEDAAKNDVEISREFLERVFFRAFKKMPKDIWHKEAIREYFLEQHNKDLEHGKSSLAPYLHEFCKVRKAKIVKKQGNVLTVRYETNACQERNVFSDFVPDAKEGDEIIIHHGYAVEKV